MVPFKNQKFRNICFTVNNWEKSDYISLMGLGADESVFKYFVMGKEVGEQGTPHLQCYGELFNQKTGAGLSKMLPKKCANIEARFATAVQASMYCKKDNKFTEFGKLSSQGKRKDLEEVAAEIAGGRSVRSIGLENPMLIHQYGRTLNQLEEWQLENKFRTEMTKGIWYWGKTGVGKSHEAFKGYDPENTYKVPDDNGWWDGYRGQETVILNEFRGDIAYNVLLEMVDKWPMHVKRRGRAPAPFLAKKVVITSSLPPWEVYHNRAERDSIEQFMRRFEVIEMTQKWSEGNNMTSESCASDGRTIVL